MTRLVAAGATASFALWCLAPSSTESAAANGDTRTLHLFHTHTGETIDATFRVDGHYDPSVLRQLNHFLRDWRNDDEISMDPRLFDAVWEAYRTAGATDRIQIYSAYRSPETNAMLRRRSRAVAEHSQHMLGKAMDTTMPGFPMSRIREAGMKLQHGGVGWYPSANFVHLDVGGVRSWPRMSYDQLADLFPDGKTVHIASDGRTLPGYDQARIEIAQRGGVEVPPAQESQGFFAWLFGGSGAGAAREDEEDRRAPAVQPAAATVAVASAEAPAQPEPAPVAEAPAVAAVVPQPPVRAAEAIQPVAPAPQLAAAGADTEDAVMPLPPRRPIELAYAPEIPLPPMRPDVLDSLQTASIRHSDAQAEPARPDAIGGLITVTTPGVKGMRRPMLPAMITRGTTDLTPPIRALAFADVEQGAAAPLPVSRPQGLSKPLALRSARRRAVAPAIVVGEASIDAGSLGALAGPKLTGLRSAARMTAERAAL